VAKDWARATGAELDWRREQTRRRWKLAHAVAEVLGVGAGVAWKWIRTLRAEGIDVQKLAEGEDAETISRAREVMKGERLPPKEKHVPPIKRSARKARRAMGDEEHVEITRRQRVQIMLWAIGKCGSAELATDALERAVSALEDANEEEG